MWGKKKHLWEWLPHFEVVGQVVLGVQICKRTNTARYVRIPSMQKLEQLERDAGKE